MNNEPPSPSQGDSENPAPFPRRYTPATSFRIVAFLFLLGSFWLASEMLRQFTGLSVLLFLLMAAVTLWMLSGAFSWLEDDGQTLHYHRPLFASHTLDIGQIVGVMLEGRRTRALIIEYHPRETRGGRRPADTAFLNLVPLRDQDVLQTALLERIADHA